MVLGRLFVWSAALSGGLLILAIGLLVWGQVTKNPGIPAGKAWSDETLDLPDSDVDASTYHPTEAFVDQLFPETAFQRTATFAGELVPQHRSSISFEVSGLVTDIAVDTGYQVTKDDVIATIDSSDLLLQKKSAESDLQRAAAVLAEMEAGPLKTTLQAARAEVDAIDAELINLNRQLKRQQELARDGVIADSELDLIQSLTSATQKRKLAALRRLEELEAGTRVEQIDAQKALLNGLQSQVELLNLQIGKTQLKAPFDGVIVETLVDQGAVVAAGQVVARLVDIENLEAQIGVPREVAESLFKQSRQSENREAGPSPAVPSFKLRAGGQSVDATLDRFLPILDPATQTVMAIFSLNRPSEEIRGNGNVGSGEKITAARKVENQFELVSGAPVYLDWQQTVESDGYWVTNDALTQARRGLWSIYAFEMVPGPPEIATETELKDSGDAEGSSPIPEASSDRPPVVGTVHKVQVEILYSIGNRSFVRGTLNPGQWIIVAGTQRLLDGQRVQVKQVDHLDAAKLPGSIDSPTTDSDSE